MLQSFSTPKQVCAAVTSKYAIQSRLDLGKFLESMSIKTLDNVDLDHVDVSEPRHT